MPVSTKAMLQKLPLRVFKRLEQVVAACEYLDWKHFDAGVVKVRRGGGGRCVGRVGVWVERGGGRGAGPSAGSG